jgi:lipid II:glycine glycyltransferase (peptidoglycan interpeptide bridge formation enzyme)
MYKSRIAGSKDYLVWNDFIRMSPNGNMRQSTYWGELKEDSGWTPHYFMVENNGGVCATALIQERKLPLVPYSLMYCCRGPVVDWTDEKTVEYLFASLRNYLRQRHAILLRMDPESTCEPKALEQILQRHGSIKLSERVTKWNRALYTTRVVLDADEQALFGRLRKKMRQNINKARREGVIVDYTPSRDDPNVFARLMTGLETRKDSLLHASSYYAKVFELLVQEGVGYFMKAKFNGEIISGLVVVVLGEKAWGVFIANDYAYRQLMPNKVLVWEAICLARKLGCRYLDLGSTQGTAEYDPVNDPLDNFKEAFNPEVLYYSGYYDIPNLFYSAFRAVERSFLPLAMRGYVAMQRLLHSAK